MGEVRATVRLAEPEVVATSLLRAGRGSPLHNAHGGQRPRKRPQVSRFARSVEPLARGWLRHSVRGGRRSRARHSLKQILLHSRHSPEAQMAVSSPQAPDQNTRNKAQTEDHIRLHANLLDAVPAALIATDVSGQIIYWNRVAEELYGWSGSEV